MTGIAAPSSGSTEIRLLFARDPRRDTHIPVPKGCST
jgi:hypothetical protein